MNKNMNNEREKKAPTVPTGRRYNSVEELLEGELIADEVKSLVRDLDKETCLVQQMVEMRKAAGLTQQQMADALGKTQGAISKLESSLDSELTVAEMHEYSNATKQRFMILFGKPLNHVEAVKWHAFGIRDHLSALASLAHKDEDIESAIQSFFTEALTNILSIVAKCHTELPNGNRVSEIRLKKLDVLALKPKRDAEGCSSRQAV